MIRLDDSRYDLPGEGRFVAPLGESPFEVADEVCDECRKSQRFFVRVFIPEPMRGRPFFGGLVFLKCARCGTAFVTRLPKPSER